MEMDVAGVGAGQYQRLEELITHWKSKIQVLGTQAVSSLLVSGYERTPTRKLAVQWLFDRCRELATSFRTPQLATTLLDLYESQIPARSLDSHLVASAGCLSLAVKVCEPYALSPNYVARLTGLVTTSEEVIAMEKEVMLVIGWHVDIVTAADVLDSVSLAGVGLPDRDLLDAFQCNCYNSPAVRFNPLLIALSPLLALHCAFAPKLCFAVASLPESEIEALLSEVPLNEAASDSDSTFSSSPDIKHIKP